MLSIIGLYLSRLYLRGSVYCSKCETNFNESGLIDVYTLIWCAITVSLY